MKDNIRNETKDVKVVGSGVSSCVVKPRFRCRNERGKINTGSIAKVMLKDDAKEETELLEKIEMLDPKGIFTLKGFRACIPEEDTRVIRELFEEQSCFPSKFRNEKKSEKLRQIIMPYGGVPLFNLTSSEFTHIYKSLSNNNDNRIVSMIFTECCRLLYGVSQLQSKMMTHNDLHYGNILVNQETGKIIIIDFGYMRDNKKEGSFLLTLRGLAERDPTQLPTEIVFFNELANKQHQLTPLHILSNDIPSDILEAIRDCSKGRSKEQLRRIMNTLPFDSVYRPYKHIFFPKDVPGMDTILQKRCMSVIGMRESTKHISELHKKTIHAYQKTLKTVDSFAIGNVINEIIHKVQISKSSLVDNDILTLMLAISKRMTTPNQNVRILSQKALDILKPVFKITTPDNRHNVEQLFNEICL